MHSQILVSRQPFAAVDTARGFDEPPLAAPVPDESSVHSEISDGSAKAGAAYEEGEYGEEEKPEEQHQFVMLIETKRLMQARVYECVCLCVCVCVCVCVCLCVCVCV